MANLNISQGQLNRILTSIVISAHPTLNITSEYMGKSFAAMHPDGPFVQQIDTGTGIVTSPEPYIMMAINVGLLRSQGLSAAWLTQIETQTVYLGTVTGYSDSTVFGPVKLRDVSVTHFDPGAWDGLDPIVALTLRGKLNINNSLWNI